MREQDGRGERGALEKVEKQLESRRRKRRSGWEAWGRVCWVFDSETNYRPTNIEGRPFCRWTPHSLILSFYFSPIPHSFFYLSLFLLLSYSLPFSFPSFDLGSSFPHTILTSPLPVSPTSLRILPFLPLSSQEKRNEREKKRNKQQQLSGRKEKTSELDPKGKRREKKREKREEKRNERNREEMEGRKSDWEERERSGTDKGWKPQKKVSGSSERKWIECVGRFLNTSSNEKKESHKILLSLFN